VTYEVVFDPGAEADLDDEEQYLAARFSERTAHSYIQRVIRFCLSLASAPHCGTRRDYVRPGMRTVGFERRATILFEVLPGKVVILGVLFGGRQIRSSQAR